jgi:hypothetical protein
MIRRASALPIATLVALFGASGPGPAVAQQTDEQSCAQPLTEQLRRFSEKCISDLVSFIGSQPAMAAKIYSENEKYYLTLTRTDDGVLAEAVSQFNYPLMKADTPDLLKKLGWAAPENESDNWKRMLSKEAVSGGGGAQDVSRALNAYGLKQGEAISLTVGPRLSDKPSSG